MFESRIKLLSRRKPEAMSNNKITTYVGMKNVKQFDTFCEVELQVWLPLSFERLV